MVALFVVLYIIGVVVGFVLGFRNFYKTEEEFAVKDALFVFVFCGICWPITLLMKVGDIKIKKS